MQLTITLRRAEDGSTFHERRGVCSECGQKIEIDEKVDSETVIKIIKEVSTLVGKGRATTEMWCGTFVGWTAICDIDSPLRERE